MSLNYYSDNNIKHYILIILRSFLIIISIIEVDRIEKSSFDLILWGLLLV